MGMQALVFWPNVDAGSEEVAKGIRLFREARPRRELPLLPQPPAGDIRPAHGALRLHSRQLLRSAARGRVPRNSGGHARLAPEPRVRENVVRTSNDADEIADAIRDQVAHGPYERDDLFGDGTAGQRIAEILAVAEPRIQKKLHYDVEEARRARRLTARALLLHDDSVPGARLLPACSRSPTSATAHTRPDLPPVGGQATCVGVETPAFGRCLPQLLASMSTRSWPGSRAVTPSPRSGTCTAPIRSAPGARAMVRRADSAALRRPRAGLRRGRPEVVVPEVGSETMRTVAHLVGRTVAPRSCSSSTRSSRGPSGSTPTLPQADRSPGEVRELTRGARGGRDVHPRVHLVAKPILAHRRRC